MPWSPSFDHDAPADPRLDAYRGRAGRISLEGDDVGYVLVETDVARLKAGGMLWWSRWEPPQECAVVSVYRDEQVHDGLTFVTDELTEQLGLWGTGSIDLGVVHDVAWLDQAESDRVHHEVFGHHH